MSEPLITQEEAATFAQVSVATIARWRAERRLTTYKRRARVLVDRAELRKLVEPTRTA